MFVVLAVLVIDPNHFDCGARSLSPLIRIEGAQLKKLLN